jgi:hypothetical protein
VLLTPPAMAMLPSPALVLLVHATSTCSFGLVFVWKHNRPRAQP